jgi:Bacterial protein of unknown function (DUF839)
MRLAAWMTGWRRTVVGTVAVGLAVTATAAYGGGAGVDGRDHGRGLVVTGLAAANPRAAGVAVPNVLSRELRAALAAQGSIPVENPADWATHYGYNGDGPLLPIPPGLTEASKTEPDKNTYLVLRGQHGADRHYDYGTHFLYQGHELGKGGYVTRVNLDADGPHRVTVLATRDAAGAPLPLFDGSVWDPFGRSLLFTAELGNRGGVWQLRQPDLTATSTARDLSGALGRGGYEGIQFDDRGQVWVVEDVGGAAAGANGKGKQPNSFIYRFVPRHRGDLTAGRLQALQVVDAPAPLTADSQFETDVHTYGRGFATRWVTIHDTATGGTVPFDANAAAKAARATPFKRPENGQFRPGTGFGEFYFTETGDTNADSPFNAGKGGWGAVFRLRQTSPAADTGRLQVIYNGDRAHTGLDNLSFLDGRRLAVVEDAGDTLHTQRNALDSGYLVDVEHPYADGSAPPRFLAEGRDASATIDAALSAAAVPGYQNEGDNEITGIHVSDGDPTVAGLIGTRVPRPFDGRWRVFFTQQHGDNVTWEILPS